MLTALRRVGFLEACSFIALAGIAMPMKYAMDMPLAVSIVGAVHGALWTIYMLMVFLAWRRQLISLNLSFGLFFLSLIPFGPFLIDGHLKRVDEAGLAEADSEAGADAEAVH